MSASPARWSPASPWSPPAHPPSPANGVVTTPDRARERPLGASSAQAEAAHAAALAALEAADKAAHRAKMLEAHAHLASSSTFGTATPREGDRRPSCGLAGGAAG